MSHPEPAAVRQLSDAFARARMGVRRWWVVAAGTSGYLHDTAAGPRLDLCKWRLATATVFTGHGTDTDLHDASVFIHHGRTSIGMDPRRRRVGTAESSLRISRGVQGRLADSTHQ